MEHREQELLKLLREIRDELTHQSIMLEERLSAVVQRIDDVERAIHKSRR